MPLRRFSSIVLDLREAFSSALLNLRINFLAREMMKNITFPRICSPTPSSL
jgi:hypothetical protein